ncbi:Zinc transporter ZitB [Candidatus Bilamarchaeum dharawalense]|uniref:Zinc transporter ZitB n=1 Tax=Candidatus Bilamarchaeum dharawalense TaxID=2885759 RepID=A0A5E4LP47_9ARCH|nr:Zinc transporter ZitB [Candidatus Bilamarchaeum dharawalense]
MGDDGGLERAFLVSLIVLIVQLFGWYYSNSLALLGDSAHVFSDIIAIGSSLLAMRLALKLPSARRTFGFHRTEVFAAFFNGILLVVMSLVIAYEAFMRVGGGYSINGLPMLFTSLFGLAGNIYVVYHLQHEENLNVRSAFLHAAGDALSSIGVLVGAILIMITGQYLIDIAVSVIVSSLILISAYTILRSSLSILLESAPYGASIDAIEKAVHILPEVKNVHDIHVWRTSSEFTFAMMHVEVEEMDLIKLRKIQMKIEEILNQRFRIIHATIQFEPVGCSCQSQKMCHIWEHKKIKHQH